MVIKWWVVFVVVVGVSPVDSKRVPNLSHSQKQVQAKSQEIAQVYQMELVIELAIFVDTEFAKIADLSHVNLLHYWEAVLYDVHLRFATLPSFKISFRVTTLQTITSETDQAFLGIGDYKEEDYLVVNIVSKFSHWIFTQQQKIPQFDIAVLLLGTIQLDRNRVLRSRIPASICRGNLPVQKMWLTNVVITMQESLPLALAQSLAETLGAPGDEDKRYWKFCNPTIKTPPYCCIMNYTQPLDSIPPHFFSHCTDQLLANAISNIKPEEFCVDRASSVRKVIIDTEKLFKNPSRVHSFTFKEQCQLLSGDYFARVEKGMCHMVHCVSNTKPMPDFLFTPLAGSVCGKNGKQSCLRNWCVESEVQLINVGTGKCLVSEFSQFSVNDKAVLRDCAKSPMDFMATPNIDSVNNIEITSIRMKYSTSYRARYKYLTLKKQSNSNFSGIFSPYNTSTKSQWIIVRLTEDSHKDSFLLMQTPFCAVATDDGKNIEFLDNCSGNNSHAVWRFKKLVTESGSTTLFFQYFLTFGTYLCEFNTVVLMSLVLITICFCRFNHNQRNRTETGKKPGQCKIKFKGQGRDRVRSRKSKRS